MTALARRCAGWLMSRRQGRRPGTAALTTALVLAVEGIGRAKYADDPDTLNSVHGGISEYTP